MAKSRLTRFEAKYTALQLAHSWVSEAAKHDYDSDFYLEIRSAGMLDKSKIDTPTKWDNKLVLFIPNDAEIKLIKKEMNKLSDKLIKEMRKCIEIYNKKTKQI